MTTRCKAHALVVYQCSRVVHFYSHFLLVVGVGLILSLLISGEKEKKKTLLYHSLFDCCNNNVHVLSHTTRVSRCVKLTLHIYVLREPPSPCTFQYPRVTFSRLCIDIADQGIDKCSDVRGIDTVGGDLFSVFFLLLLF